LNLSFEHKLFLLVIDTTRSTKTYVYNLSLLLQGLADDLKVFIVLSLCSVESVLPT